MPPQPFWRDLTGQFGIFHLPHAAWQSGGITRSFPVGDWLRNGDLDAARRRHSQSVVYVSPDIAQSDNIPFLDNEIAALEAVHGILHRSELTPVDLSTEQAIRDSVPKLVAAFSRSKKPDLQRALISAYSTASNQNDKPPVRKFEDEYDGVSAEREFWGFIAYHCPELLPLLQVQVPVAFLLDSSNPDPLEQRRADFVLGLQPRGKTQARGIVIEIHGHQKAAGANPLQQIALQAIKRRDLEQAGWEVLDISRAEILAARGQWRPILLERATYVRGVVRSADPGLVSTLECAWCASQLDLALLHAVARGWISRSSPEVVLFVPAPWREVAKVAFDRWLALVDAVQQIWGVSVDRRCSSWLRLEIADTSVTNTDAESRSLNLIIDPYSSSYLATDHLWGMRSVIVRRGNLPFNMPLPRLGVSFDQGATQRTLAHLQPNLESTLEALSPAFQVLIQRILGYKALQPGQAEGVYSCLARRDQLVLMPTGSGKSAIFVLASFLLPGATLVVEPFISLIDDQVRRLQDEGISRVGGIHSGKQQQAHRLEDSHLIYLSPERLYLESFEPTILQLVRERGLDLLVVDEAHSASEFGHSFRPSYLGYHARARQLVRKAGQPGGFNVLALTATAVYDVVNDVQSILGIREPPFRLPGAFGERNLTTVVRLVEPDSTGAGVRHALESVLSEIADGAKVLVFCTSKGNWAGGWIGVKGASDAIAAWLLQHKRSEMITTYHGDLAQATKAQASKDFRENRGIFMVATSAFGTGVDIRDIDYVIHLGAPAGLEAWYQESGRAGRGHEGPKSTAYAIVDIEKEAILRFVEAEQNWIPGDLRSTISSGLGAVQGSLGRQAQLMLGNSVVGLAVDPQVALPRNEKGKLTYFLGSFPGIEFEHSNYDAYLLKLILEARESEVLIPLHPDHDAFVWKAIHRLAILGLLKDDYSKVYSNAGDHHFTVTRAVDFAKATSDEGLLKNLNAHGARILGASWKGDLSRDKKTANSLQQGVHAATAQERIFAALHVLCTASYEAVRRLRMQSIRAMIKFFTIENEDARTEFLNGYLTEDQNLLDLIQDARTKGEDHEIWEQWNERIGRMGEGFRVSGVLAQARIQAKDSLLVEYLDLAHSLRWKGVPQTLDSEQRLPLMRLLSKWQSGNFEAVAWALEQILEEHGGRWLDALNNLVRLSETEPTGSEDALRSWLLTIPHSHGQHTVVADTISGWFRRALQ